MKARCFESIATRPVDELKLLASQFAQVDQVTLQLVAVDNRRVDGQKQSTAQMFELSVAACVWPEFGPMFDDEFLFELLVKRLDLGQQRAALGLDLSPLGRVAVERLESKAQAVSLQLDLVIRHLFLDYLQFALQCLVCLQALKTLDLSRAHVVHQRLVW